MSIGEILDACDLHLIYLQPGVFAELKLKKKHGKLDAFSPPKFPEWTSHGSSCSGNHQTDHDNLDDTSLDFDQSALLKAFLNIKTLSESSIEG